MAVIPSYCFTIQEIMADKDELVFLSICHILTGEIGAT